MTENDILRALDYFQAARVPFDSRLKDALEVLISKRRADGRWPTQAAHPGNVHFQMEKTGEPGRWNSPPLLEGSCLWIFSADSPCCC